MHFRVSLKKIAENARSNIRKCVRVLKKCVATQRYVCGCLKILENRVVIHKEGDVAFAMSPFSF